MGEIASAVPGSITGPVGVVPHPTIIASVHAVTSEQISLEVFIFLFLQGPGQFAPIHSGRQPYLPNDQRMPGQAHQEANQEDDRRHSQYHLRSFVERFRYSNTV